MNMSGVVLPWLCIIYIGTLFWNCLFVNRRDFVLVVAQKDGRHLMFYSRMMVHNITKPVLIQWRTPVCTFNHREQRVFQKLSWRLTTIWLPMSNKWGNYVSFYVVRKQHMNSNIWYTSILVVDLLRLLDTYAAKSCKNQTPLAHTHSFRLSFIWASAESIMPVGL